MNSLTTRGFSPLFLFYNPKQKWSKIQNYKNPDLQKLFEDRVLQKNKIQIDPEIIFFELKKLLFILSESQKKFSHVNNFMVFDQFSLLDEYWHMFILMTEEYNWFCKNILGKFLHHAPEIPNKLENTNYLKRGFENELRDQIKLVITFFGKETAYDWYISEKYCLSKLLKSEE